MKPLAKIIVLGVVIIAVHILFTTKVQAVSLSYSNYDVDIQVNTDSTFTVTETANYILNGTAHGLIRDLTLYDSARSQNCINNPDLTCGGFDRVNVISVTDNTGRELNSDELTEGTVTDDNGNQAYEFRWTIWPDGQDVTNYKVGWVIKYKIYGGIQKIGSNPYFYWNMLPEARNGFVSSSVVKLSLPSSVSLSENNLSVFSDYNYDQTQTSDGFQFNLKNLSDLGNFTVAYKFNSNEINLPGSIKYQITSPQYGTEVYLDGAKVDQTISPSEIKSVEAGDHLLEIKHVGYQTFSQKITVKQGETQSVQVSLVPEAWMSLLLVLNNLFLLLGCLLIPGAIAFVYWYYRRHGRDENMPKTIIPLYAPPKDTPPYLLGTLKDESVDKEDIVGSIIDLAYRGFIKIKELDKGKNYELDRLAKDTSSLNETEKQILDAIFNGEDVQETEDMQTYFPTKYVKLTSRIYSEVVEKGFFARSPKTTIGIYAGLGFFLLIMGGAGLVFLSPVLTVFLGYITVFTLGAAIAVLGFSFLIVAKFMPAKTALGSKMFADILGFKMYLHTAERFRLQKLGPDEFEKYLSYAVVFGIEKEWAKKFEGIYNRQPEWFEGNYNAWDVWVISNFVGSFRNASVTSMTPMASRSASGGGWSGGGGSFGGFSGGGGGGGGSGAW